MEPVSHHCYLSSLISLNAFFTSFGLQQTVPGQSLAWMPLLPHLGYNTLNQTTAGTTTPHGNLPLPPHTSHWDAFTDGSPLHPAWLWHPTWSSAHPSCVWILFLPNSGSDPPLWGMGSPPSGISSSPTCSLTSSSRPFRFIRLLVKYTTLVCMVKLVVWLSQINTRDWCC